MASLKIDLENVIALLISVAASLFITNDKQKSEMYPKEKRLKLP